MATVALTTVPTPANAAASSSAAATEEEIAKKKNTDCVYFLASPLTCKKGDECEFRHSESARLNPRDCWYWVGGNCLNRDCPFRHPPLEARAAATAPQPSGHSHAHSHSHPSKKPVPCFFFSQGYCVKGSKCQFLHGSGHQKEQHDNAVSTAMVYRLSDASKPTVPASDSGKARPETMTVTVTEGESRKDSSGNERKKDNVYRLQDDPKKGKLKEGSETGADAQKKQQKDSAYTWRLSENAPSKQQNPPKTGPRRGSSHKSSEGRGNAQAAEQQQQNNDTMVEDKEFASPKSLAQIREEKHGDELQGKGKRKLATDAAESLEQQQDQSRRRLSNGSAGTSNCERIADEGLHSPAAAAADSDRLKAELDEDGNAADSSRNVGAGFDDEDEDDFAQKLGGLFQAD